MTYEYEDVRRVVYGDGATFVPVCPHCRRFVKADATMTFDGLGYPKDFVNGTCGKCGRVEMPFEGFV